MGEVGRSFYSLFSEGVDKFCPIKNYFKLVTAARLSIVSHYTLGPISDYNIPAKNNRKISLYSSKSL